MAWDGYGVVCNGLVGESVGYVGVYVGVGPGNCAWHTGQQRAPMPSESVTCEE